MRDLSSGGRGAAVVMVVVGWAVGSNTVTVVCLCSVTSSHMILGFSTLPFPQAVYSQHTHTNCTHTHIHTQGGMVAPSQSTARPGSVRVNLVSGLLYLYISEFFISHTYFDFNLFSAALHSFLYHLYPSKNIKK